MKQLTGASAPQGGMAKNRKVQVSEEFLQTSLARCILKQDSQLALLCLEQGEDPGVRCQTTGRGLFHLVSTEASPMTETKFVPFVYILSNAGLDLDVTDNQGVTPLQLAIRGGLLEVMTALLKCGAQCQGDEEQLAEKHGGLFPSEFVTVLRKLTPGYWQAVGQNNTFRVNKLAKSWCRVNLSRHGQSLIEYAKATAKDPKLIKHLLDSEASIELAHAVMAGDAQRMRVLLCDQAVDLATTDLSNRESYFEPFSPLTLYGAALKYGHKHLLGMLRDVKDLPGAGRAGAVAEEEEEEERGGKQERVTCSQAVLAMCQENNKNQEDFFDRQITQDETWYYHYDLETKAWLKQWKHFELLPPKEASVQLSVGKVMLTVFGDQCGVVMMDFLAKGTTVMGTYYASLLQKLREAIKTARRGMLTKIKIAHGTTITIISLPFSSFLFKLYTTVHKT
ncbi:uncharacterized protein LOC143297688 [Babylonia areolata]|uniref:uncharacterized protein LOC143297688 n=1 Tax=Babylonia areolata TaxID=304850 RepID=UPI003FD68FEA